MRHSLYRALAAIVYPAFLRKVVADDIDQLPANGGFILACNHVDWLDGFYIGAAVEKYRRVPTHFLTASHNYWWTTIAVPIPADRSMIVPHAVDILRSGKIICNFIEGARNPASQLLPGKTGTVRMALEARVPIVPVGITCDAGQSMGQSLRYLLSAQHPVRLAFGEPLHIEQPDGEVSTEWLNQQTQLLMQRIAPLAGKHV